MTIDEVKRIQRDNDLLNAHVVWIGPTHFSIAHTDHERATLHPLTNCLLHDWLERQEYQPYEDGVYVVTNSYDGWEFVPLEGGEWCPKCGSPSASYPAEVYCVECATT
jgi:hypothetical protein